MCVSSLYIPMLLEGRRDQFPMLQNFNMIGGDGMFEVGQKHAKKPVVTANINFILSERVAVMLLCPR